jgi:hypothetical protein
VARSSLTEGGGTAAIIPAVREYDEVKKPQFKVVVTRDIEGTVAKHEPFGWVLKKTSGKNLISRAYTLTLVREPGVYPRRTG